ncbi:hypothetical protein K431DRAFT_334716 [Polychaeton citri CBS 116435]|uniref:RNase III domain-containing protein n=1 Tax=Polychaeton citri CBS 116435 TaxID=1314669 RepID=A0A9P4URL2_9PEZI|nr:hypothetical protein K431DRAFT_334716 [Polychaeton citri CBS 116435]
MAPYSTLIPSQKAYNVPSLLNTTNITAMRNVASKPKIINVRSQVSLWAKLTENASSQHNWCAALASLKFSGELVLELKLWMPYSFQYTDTITLYWDQSVTLTLTIQPTQETMAPRDPKIEHLRRCTSLILASVYDKRFDVLQDSFAIMFETAEGQDISAWCDANQGNLPANVEATNIDSSMDCGLIRSKDLPYELFFQVPRVRAEQIFDSFEHISAKTCLIGIPLTQKRNFLHAVPTSVSEGENDSKEQVLSRGSCTVDKLPSKYGLLAALFPSITYQMDISFVAHQFTHFSRASMTLQAICAPSVKIAGGGRPKYLGEKMLKFCAGLQAMAVHLDYDAHELTEARLAMTSNSRLCQAGLESGLDNLIVDKAFGVSKWKPPTASLEPTHAKNASRALSSRTIADVAVSLIGAAFADGGYKQSLNCLTYIMRNSFWYDEQKSNMILLTASDPFCPIFLPTLEQIIGYSFNRRSLLVEALSHESHAKYVGMSYERLEFFGDAVLDLIVAAHIQRHPRILSPAQINRIHCALVNSHTLGFLCMKMKTSEYGDVCTEHVDLDGHIRLKIQRKQKTVSLHDFLRIDSDLFPIKKASFDSFQQLEGRLDWGLWHDRAFPWADLLTLSLDKMFSDIIESILGAIYIDSEGNWSACEAFVERLGLLKLLQRLTDADVDAWHPKERITILADRRAVKYDTQMVEVEGRISWQSTLSLRDGREFTATCCRTKDEASTRAAAQAARVIQDEMEGVAGKRKRTQEILSSLV